MSHWQAGKLNLKCSIDVLRRALINIMPEWEEHIRVDESGRIPIYDYVGRKMEGEGFNIIIPGIRNPNYSGAPGLKYNDVGLRRKEDGSWEAQVDNSGLTKIANLEGNIAGEVARMKAKAVARLRGYAIRRDESNDEESVTEIVADADAVRQLMRA